jgi:hypothetical protein
MEELWSALHPAFRVDHVDADPVLAVLYTDLEEQLELCDFTLVPGAQPHVTARPARPQAPPYQVIWAPGLALEEDAVAGLLLHLLTRVAVAEMYRSPAWVNVNLPAPDGELVDGLADNQRDSLARQQDALEHNWASLERIEAEERVVFGPVLDRYLTARIHFGAAAALTHNDAILAELVYQLRAKALTGTRTHACARLMLREANHRRRDASGQPACRTARRAARR